LTEDGGEGAAEVDAVDFASTVPDPTLRDRLFRQLADTKPSACEPAEFDALLNRLKAVDLRRRRDAMDRQQSGDEMEDEAAWQRLLAEKKKLEQQVERLKGG